MVQMAACALAKRVALARARTAAAERGEVGDKQESSSRVPSATLPEESSEGDKEESSQAGEKQDEESFWTPPATPEALFRLFLNTPGVQLQDGELLDSSGEERDWWGFPAGVFRERVAEILWEKADPPWPLVARPLALRALREAAEAELVALLEQAWVRAVARCGSKERAVVEGRDVRACLREAEAR